MTEQESIRDRVDTTQTSAQSDALINHVLNIFAQNQPGEKNSLVAPRIGICPDCNPPIDLPPNDPPEPPPPPPKGRK